jgi:hypothetical protein
MTRWILRIHEWLDFTSSPFVCLAPSLHRHVNDASQERPRCRKLRPPGVGRGGAGALEATCFLAPLMAVLYQGERVKLTLIRNSSAG